jgi:hypothetical protein
VRRARVGFTHLQLEALLIAARESCIDCDFALVTMLGLLGLRIFEATGANITDLGEEHGHRVLRVCGKGSKVVLVPLPPAVGRAFDCAIGARTRGPILLNSRGARMDRHAATRRLRGLSEGAGVRIARPHPHMLRHNLRDHHARRRRRPARRPDRSTPRRPENHDALRQPSGIALDGRDSRGSRCKFALTQPQEADGAAGLGLAILRDIATAHGAAVTLAEAQRRRKPGRYHPRWDRGRRGGAAVRLG